MGSITEFLNEAVDTTQAIADNPLISLIGLVFPQANAIIDVIRRNKAVIDAAQPVISAAVQAGEPVFEKAVEAFPKFATAISQIMHMVPSDIGGVAMVENVTRILGGYRPMTFEQEMEWMRQTTPGNDPSEENSKFPVG